MAHLWSGCLARRIILRGCVLRYLAWRRGSSPAVVSLGLLLLWRILMLRRHGRTLIICRVLRLRRGLRRVRVSCVGGRSAVLWLRLSRVETFRRTADIRRSAGLQIRIWPRRLTRRGQVVASNAVLAEGFREAILQHPVVVANSCLEFGMQVEESV